jgi:hypothetical protein
LEEREILDWKSMKEKPPEDLDINGSIMFNWILEK